jgi:hypothetical protein
LKRVSPAAATENFAIPSRLWPMQRPKHYLESVNIILDNFPDSAKKILKNQVH